MSAPVAFVQVRLLEQFNANMIILGASGDFSSKCRFFNEELGMMNEEFNLFVSELGYDVDDIYSVTYFTDVFELENNKLIFRHIDIDFINGEFLELNDTDKRYQRLKEIFSVNETDFENDMLLYKRGEQCD